MATRRYTEKLPQVRAAMQTEGDFESCAARLKALADPDRLRIVNILLGGHKNVTELADEMGTTIVKISHHLGVLRAAHVVQTQKQGKFVIYSLPSDIAASSQRDGGIKTLDLGCCQLDLVQPKLPSKKHRESARKNLR